MDFRSSHDRRISDESVRGDLETVGAWTSRAGGSDILEIVGLSGVVTRVVELADGTIEIRTDAMTADGHAVRVPQIGRAHVIDC